jgi:TolB-like protein
MSGDPEQEYFADGITEDIITELARFQNLLVIARNSVFTYKGKAVRVEDVGRELGVDYVAEGSIRKAGNRVRVTIQLIDAETGNHVWAERYDRDLADIFDLQDELTQTIVAALPRRLESADVERSASGASHPATWAFTSGCCVPSYATTEALRKTTRRRSNFWMKLSSSIPNTHRLMPGRPAH